MVSTIVKPKIVKPNFGRSVNEIIGKGMSATIERDNERLASEPQTILISVTVQADFRDIEKVLRQSFSGISVKALDEVVPASRLEDMKSYYETVGNDFEAAVNDKVEEIVEDMPSVTEIWNQSDAAIFFECSPSTIARWHKKKPFLQRAANGRGWRIAEKDARNYVPPNMGKRGRKKKVRS